MPEVGHNVLRIINPEIDFPELVLDKGVCTGIYTEEVNRLTKNIYKIICEPNKYAEKVTINEIIANTSAWVGRAFTHIVSPELWEDSILNILKNKSNSRHLIIISANKENVDLNELAEISKLVSKYKENGAVLIITNSKELLEATVDSLFDEKGQEVFIETGEYFFNANDEEVFDISEIKENVSCLKYKKIKINLEDKNVSLEDLNNLL